MRTSMMLNRATLALSMVAGMTLGIARITLADDKPGDPMSGPTVSTPKPTKPTLVRLDIAGKLEKIEGRPEVAALRLLSLTPEQKTATEKLVADRYALASKTLQDHTSLFLAIQGARQAQNTQELPARMKEMREAAKDLLNPPFATTVVALLDEKNAAIFKELVKEYVDALAKDQANSTEMRPNADRQVRRRRGGENDLLIPPQIEMNLVLREMGKSLANVVAERKERSAALLKAVDASPEQEAKIQELTRAAGEKYGQSPTAEQKGELMKQIMAELTTEQRKKLTEHLRNR